MPEVVAQLFVNEERRRAWGAAEQCLSRLVGEGGQLRDPAAAKLFGPGRREAGREAGLGSLSPAGGAAWAAEGQSRIGAHRAVPGCRAISPAAWARVSGGGSGGGRQRCPLGACRR